MVRVLKPCSASLPTTISSAMSFEPVTTRSGIAAACPISVTRRARAGVERRCERVDLEEAVGLREACHRAGAFGGRERDRPVLARDQRHQHEFLAAELRRNAHRHLGLDGARRFRRQARLGADHRRDESMEREDRRGRKARQHHQRLALDHREAERLAGLERHAVHDHARLAELRHHAMREIACALRGAAREQHHVAGLERGAHRKLERDLVVRKAAERHRPRRRSPAPPPRRWRRWNRRPPPAAAARPAAPARRRSRARRRAAFARRRPRRCRRPRACRSRASRCARHGGAPPRRARCRSRHRR